MEQGLELHLRPESARFDALDDRWLDQIQQFGTELGREIGDVTRVRQPVPGTKGTLDSVLLSVGSAGVLSATVEFLRAWLQRDSSRTLRVSWTDAGALQQVELSGESLEPAAIETLMQAVTSRLAEP